MRSDWTSLRRAWTTRFVWGVWAMLSVAAIGLSFFLGFDLPYWDDWGDLVPVYAGSRPLDAEKLWSSHNGHRIPLSRLILVGLGRATNHDLRAGAILSAVALSASSAILLRSARGVDGRLRLADCALPLLLLHWGQYITLLWSYQLHAALFALVSSALLVIILRSSDPPSARLTLAFGAGLVVLPLCQAGGIALAPVLSAWLGAVGVLGLRSSESTRRRAGLVALALVAAAVALTAVAFVPPHRRGDPARVPWSSAVVLSTGFGVTEWRSPFLRLLLPAVAATMLLSTVVLLLRVWRTQPRERLRALGLGLFLLAFLGLAIGIAWGRRGPLMNRYAALAAPFLCALYLAWRRYGPGRSGTWVCAATCATLVMLTPRNTETGLTFAQRQAKTSAAFKRDARAGVPIDELLSRYVPALNNREPSFRRGLIQMAAELGLFRTER